MQDSFLSEQVLPSDKANERQPVSLRDVKALVNVVKASHFHPRRTLQLPSLQKAKRGECAANIKCELMVSRALLTSPFP